MEEKTSVPKAEEKLSPGDTAADSAFSNFWYHYKWHTLIGLFVLVFLIIVISQMAGKKGYDAHVLYTGPAYLDKETCMEITQAIEKAAAASAPFAENKADYNKDGILTLDFNKFIYVPEALAEEYKESNIYYNALDNVNARGDFDNALMIGEYVILLMDRTLYEDTVEVGVYRTWEETVGYKPEKALDDCGILLTDLDIGLLNGFRQLPDDTVLCCRQKSYANKLNKHIQNAEMYEAEVALFCQMIEYKAEETE